MSALEVAIGIDIGGTNTKFGFVDKSGITLAEHTIPTKGNDTKDIKGFLSYLYEEIENQKQAIGRELNIKGVGMGAPNGNFYKGTIEYAPNLDFEGIVPIVELFKQYYDLPMVLTNDANAAAIGEMIYGDAQGLSDFVLITLGTGLGSGYVVGGKMVYGNDGFAGELGHTVLIRNGRICGCGKRGHLEAYTSATGIVRTIFELMSEYMEESSLRNISYHEMTAKKITEAAHQGDFLAKKAFELTGAYLGEALADNVKITSPGYIFMLGGLAKAGDLIFEPTRRHFENNLLEIHKNKIDILPSGLEGRNAAVLGASALVWKEIEGIDKN